MREYMAKYMAMNEKSEKAWFLVLALSSSTGISFQLSLSFSLKKERLLAIYLLIYIPPINKNLNIHMMHATLIVYVPLRKND